MIQIEESPFHLENITGPIPSYYFPIASYENLIEKVNELYTIRTGQQRPSGPSISGGVPIPRQFQRFFPPPTAPRPSSTPVQRGPQNRSMVAGTGS